MTADDILERIRTDYAELRSQDTKRTVFGAKSHQYARNEPLSDEAVAEFERAHNISLPDDYRRFVTEIADGGGGPAYGVHRLEGAYHNPWMRLGPLDAPFELTDDHGANYDGCLLISQRGCGGWTFLIVTGPMRGEIWYDDTVVDRGFTRASENFLSWYTGWLTSSLNTTAGQPKDEVGELVNRLMELAESAPERLSEVLDQEPNEEWLLKPLASVALTCLQSGRSAAALPLYQRLFRLPVAEKKGGARTAYLEALNNGIIAACMAPDLDSAVAISDLAQPYVEENPYIAHSAACAYMMAGDRNKALHQCRLAVQYGYPHLDQVETDEDLAPLHDDPEFKKLFGK